MTDRWPGRCDLCNSELVIGEVCYTYFTPSTGSQVEAATGKAFWAQDPEWAVCEDCKLGLDMYDKGLIDTKTWALAQTEKSLAHQPTVLGDRPEDEAMRQVQVDHTMKTLVGFIQHKGPDYVTEVNEGVEQK